MAEQEPAIEGGRPQAPVLAGAVPILAGADAPIFTGAEAPTLAPDAPVTAQAMDREKGEAR